MEDSQDVQDGLIIQYIRSHKTIRYKDSQVTSHL